jgi:hypothetical protein
MTEKIYVDLRSEDVKKNEKLGSNSLDLAFAFCILVAGFRRNHPGSVCVGMYVEIGILVRKVD